MGNDIHTSEFNESISKCIELVLEYKTIINDSNCLNREFLYRSKEIIWSIEALKNQINVLKKCIDNDDFSYTDQEKRYYATRMLFLLRMT
jgi:hypothetical protein